LLVRKRLREVGEPITYFGEKAPGRRERLREVLARMAVDQLDTGKTSKEAEDAKRKKKAEEDEKNRKAYLVEGPKELRVVRSAIAEFSLPRAKARVLEQKRKREDPKPGEEEADVRGLETLENKLRRFGNLSSEVGDERPISSCSFHPSSNALATASWSGVCKVWSVPDCKQMITLRNQDSRVTDIAWHPHAGSTQADTSINLATCNVDNQVLLFPCPKPDQDGDTEMSSSSSSKKAPVVSSIATLDGHTSRCSRIAFHPSGRFLGSTSYDCTWRLWDLTTQKCVLTQGGHSRPVYGIAFQGDGSLAATGDLGGNVRLWDLRTGKSLIPLNGHSKQVLCASFHPNGYQLATGSGDHTVRIWDLRKKMSLYTIPAHTKLVSNVQYQPDNGAFLLSSGYDNTAKVWSANDFALLKTLSGHESYVMRAEVSADAQHIATTSYDRTWKLWKHDRAGQEDAEFNIDDL
jgi:U4/U6 small nuclear ribonucleoprotein PRP4